MKSWRVFPMKGSVALQEEERREISLCLCLSLLSADPSPLVKAIWARSKKASVYKPNLATRQISSILILNFQPPDQGQEHTFPLLPTGLVFSRPPWLKSSETWLNKRDTSQQEGKKLTLAGHLPDPRSSNKHFPVCSHLLQIRTQKIREVRYLAQSHTASKQ